MKFKMPKQLAACADQLYRIRQERLKLQQQVENLAKFETQLKDRIIAELPKSLASGIAGKIARAQLDTKSIPQAEDWPLIYKYIRRNNRFDFLHRRLNEKAIGEMWDAKKEIPGVGKFSIVTVSCTKLGAKK